MGRDLTEAASLLAAQRSRLGPEEITYIEASLSRRAREEKNWQKLYEKAERQRRLALARQLAAQAELVRGNSRDSDSFIKSALIALESLRHQPTLEGDLAISRCLDLLGRELARLEHKEVVTAVAFSPDGDFLATACADHTARLWDLQGRELARLNHEGSIESVAFSPDGEFLATASLDKTARLWLWRLEDLTAEACRRLPRNLTREEWRQYLGDEPYRPTCPELPIP